MKFRRNFTKISQNLLNPYGIQFPDFSPTFPRIFPDFSPTSSSSAGRRKCPACADLASNCARPAAALRDERRGAVAGEVDRERALVAAGGLRLRALLVHDEELRIEPKDTSE